MYQVIVVVHVLLGLGLVGLILMQQGKGADAGAAFGSGSSGSVFGAQGAASFLSRTTAIFATLFFSTSLGLAVLSGHQTKTVDLMDTVGVESKVVDVPLQNTSELGNTEIPVSVEDAPTVVPAMDKAVTPEEPLVADVPAISTDVESEPSASVVEETKVAAEPKSEPVVAKHKEEKPAKAKSDSSEKKHKADKKDEKDAGKK
jgi:preprotein translocase subunit SecG